MLLILYFLVLSMCSFNTIPIFVEDSLKPTKLLSFLQKTLLIVKQKLDLKVVCFWFKAY